MVQRPRLRALARRCVAPIAAAATLFAISATALAQEYTCFPTCSTTDGRFLSLAGKGLNTFAGDEIRVGIGMPGNSDTLEFGIFDGETGGYWDIDTMPLRYQLYADSTGDGTHAVLLDEWIGNIMSDNAWYTIKMANAAAARASNGNYSYYMQIKAVDTTRVSTSSFKLRTTGTITIRSHQAFSIYAPMTKAADAGVVYPSYPDLSNATYDGTWTIYLDVPTPSSKFSIWDGDMDHGSYDGSAMDTDDPNTSSTLPEWSTPAVRAEGVAYSAYTVRDPVNTTRTDLMSGDPADDNSNSTMRRTGAIYYQVIDPNNVVYQNLNPSGNLEWENFVIDTAGYDASVNDVHASSLPAGMYKIRIIGMDMGNVNAWRFFNEVIGTGPNNEVVGVNIAGNPVVPVRAYETVNGSVTGVVFYDADTNGVMGTDEIGIPSLNVILTKYYADGTVAAVCTTQTNASGTFAFDTIGAAAYTITVDASTLQEDVVPVADSDGDTSASVTSVTIDGNDPDASVFFAYKRLSPTLSSSSGGPGTSNSTFASGTRTRGYWVNHPEAWPVSALYLGSVEYTRDQAIAILKRATKKDKKYSLASQLIAAKLNLYAMTGSFAPGSSATNYDYVVCILTTVTNADEWLDSYFQDAEGRIVGDSDEPIITGDSDAWTTGNTATATSGSSIHTTLDSYNNGDLCADHLD